MLHVCVLTGAISIHKCYASHHMHKPHGSSGISEKHSQDRPSPVYFFFQAEDGIRDWSVTGVQTCLFRSWRAPQVSYGGYFLNPANAHPTALPRAKTARGTPNARRTTNPTRLHGAGGGA